MLKIEEQNVKSFKSAFAVIKLEKKNCVFKIKNFLQVYEGINLKRVKVKPC